MKVKKLWQTLLWLMLLLLILMNIVAFNHAWKFTHFDEHVSIKTKNPEELGLAEKLETLLFGISNPRPVNLTIPALPYETFHVKGTHTIEVWKMTPSVKARGVVILFHGYGSSKGGMLDKAEAFLALGYQAVLVDFYGSGGLRVIKLR